MGLDFFGRGCDLVRVFEVVPVVVKLSSGRGRGVRIFQGC